MDQKIVYVFALSLASGLVMAAEGRPVQEEAIDGVKQGEKALRAFLQNVDVTSMETLHTVGPPGLTVLRHSRKSVHYRFVNGYSAIDFAIVKEGAKESVVVNPSYAFSVGAIGAHSSDQLFHYDPVTVANPKVMGEVNEKLLYLLCAYTLTYTLPLLDVLEGRTNYKTIGAETAELGGKKW